MFGWRVESSGIDIILTSLVMSPACQLWHHLSFSFSLSSTLSFSLCPPLIPPASCDTSSGAAPACAYLRMLPPVLHRPFITCMTRWPPLVLPRMRPAPHATPACLAPPPSASAGPCTGPPRLRPMALATAPCRLHLRLSALKQELEAVLWSLGHGEPSDTCSTLAPPWPRKGGGTRPGSRNDRCCGIVEKRP